MRFSSLFVANPAVAVLSIALLVCGLSGTAMSRTATVSGGPATSLPNVVVEAPRQVARPQQPRQRTVSRSTVSPLDIAKLSDAVGAADSRTACEACECHWQLRRRLRDKLQVKRRPLARTLRV